MITIWHNPRCSKSRQALTLLQDSGANITIRKYLEDAPTLDDLRAAQAALGLPVIDMMRPKEPEFRDRGLSRDMDDATLLRAMAETPKLIERPIVFRDGKALIARPPERVRDLL
ncbi:arsenate reductase (glutaredoxin) [Mesobacterium sp. TK19101]|uniref:Arsenate reductase n=1 Tax=Mesobacterium hydrothermale TaxID=3111907 RepID=A0ABU6HJ35_9RHOB|nr:arsenate reductase (glutaredoxin) [Mesobacterium sp. TK19101]MEC3862474.1 arsenate reductase (glutaredoxin) [Mesobacterium sp. TK19101]